MSKVITFVTALGTSILKDLYDFFKSSVGKVSLAIGLFYVFCSIFPYQFYLYPEIEVAIKSDTCKTFFRNLSFLIPIGFTIKCIVFCFMSHYFNALFNLLKFIFNIIFSTKGDNSSNAN